MEAIIFVTYVATLSLPVLFPEMSLPDITGMFPHERHRIVQEFLDKGAWRQQKDFTWFLTITPFYGLHLIIGWRASRYFSTPLVHVLTPTIMGMVMYYRLLTQPILPGAERILISGSPLEAVTLFLIFVALTLVVARLRLARYMLNFRGIDWDLTTPARIDHSFWRLVPQLTPVIYPPRVYHVFSEGVVVEGWLYALAIPFDTLETVKMRRIHERIASDLVLATSEQHMVEFKLKDSQTHILLSPTDYQEFSRYALQRVVGLREEQGHLQVLPDDEVSANKAKKQRQSAFAPGGIYARNTPEHLPTSEEAPD